MDDEDSDDLDSDSDIENDTTYDTIPETTYDTTPETTYDTTPETIYDTTPETTYDTTPETTYVTTPETTYVTTPETTYVTTPETTYVTTPETTYVTTPETTYDTTPETTYVTTPETTYDTNPETTYVTTPETTYVTTPETTFVTTPETTYDTTPETTYVTTPETTYDTTPETTYVTTPETTFVTTPETTYDTTPETTYVTTPETTYVTNPETTYVTSPETTYDTTPGSPYNISQDSTYYTDFEVKDRNTDNIFNNCTGLEFFQGLCSPNNTNKEEDTEYIYHILDQSKEDKFKEIFNKTIVENTNIIQYDNNITYQISTVTSQYSANLSTVSLEKCESILKEIYSIDQNEKLILLKLEHNVENAKIPIIEYQLFTKDGLKLNLSYCDEIHELVSIPVNISVVEEFIHDPNSDFYQDRCYTYTSEYGTDLTLYDRKKNFNEKLLALCEKNCVYKGYNNTDKTANCECKTKNEFPKYTTEKFDVKYFLYQFIDFGKISNIFVFTCPKVLFTSKGFRTNSGNYFNSAIIASIVTFAIFFYLKGYHSFREKINNIMNEKFPEETTEITKINNITQITENDIKLKENNYNDYEMNNLKYDEALKLDNRTFSQSFISKSKENFLPIFIFFIKDDYNSTEIVICLFLFGLSLDYAVRALFFNDSTMHKIYEDKGKYNFLY